MVGSKRVTKQFYVVLERIHEYDFNISKQYDSKIEVLEYLVTGSCKRCSLLTMTSHLYPYAYFQETPILLRQVMFFEKFKSI